MDAVLISSSLETLVSRLLSLVLRRPSLEMRSATDLEFCRLLLRLNLDSLCFLDLSLSGSSGL